MNQLLALSQNRAPAYPSASKLRANWAAFAWEVGNAPLGIGTNVPRRPDLLQLWSVDDRLHRAPDVRRRRDAGGADQPRRARPIPAPARGPGDPLLPCALAVGPSGRGCARSGRPCRAEGRGRAGAADRFADTRTDAGASRSA